MRVLAVLSAALLVQGNVPLYEGASFDLYEGDIQMPKAGRAADVQSNTGVNKASLLWPLGKVPYFIASGVTNSKNPHPSFSLSQNEPMVIGAVANWEEKTCIRFSRCVQGSCPANHVFFISDKDACNSPLGMTGANQINLSDQCGLGASIHEVGHTLGLAHEQARNDRDEYVYYDATQVEDGKGPQFDKTGPDARAIGPYNYGSIMHYGANGFTIGIKPTLIAPVPIGQREGLSPGDIEGIHFIYNDCSNDFVKPRCMVSRTTDTTHLVAYNKEWTVEFNGIYTVGTRLTITYDGTTADSTLLTTSVPAGTDLSDIATVLAKFTAPQSEAGKSFKISATFSSGGQEATCSVDVKVADSDAVCFGIPASEPTVCSSRGTCQNNPLAPCKCQTGYGGLQCLGFETCPTNFLNSFDDTIGTWSPIGDESGRETTFTAVGDGALRAKRLPEAGQSSLPMQKAAKPERVSWYMASMDDGTSIGFSMEGGNDGKTKCIAMQVQNKVMFVDGKDAPVVWEHNKYFHIDVHIDWSTSTSDLYVDGHLEMKGTPFSNDCGAGIVYFWFFGNGWIDEFHMWCTGYVKMTGSMLDGLTQDDLRAGGKELTLTLVGDYDEWVDTDENKQAILDSMHSAAPAALGWNARKSEMIPLTRLNINGQKLVIGPLKADATYANSASEMVDFHLTGSMFKSGEAPQWSSHDVEFQIPGTCDGTLYKSFDTDSDKSQIMTIDTVNKKVGAGCGSLTKGYDQVYPAKNVKADSLKFLGFVQDAQQTQFTVKLVSPAGSSIPVFLGAGGYSAYELSGVFTRLEPMNEVQWYQFEVKLDWTAKTYEIFIDDKKVATDSMPADFLNIEKIVLNTFAQASLIDEMTLSCAYRAPSYNALPTCPLVGKDIIKMRIFPGSDAIAVTDEVAIVPETSTDCSTAAGDCADLGACSKSTGSMNTGKEVGDSAPIVWTAGSLSKLKAGSKYKICYKPTSTGSFVLLDDVFTTCEATAAPKTEAPKTAVPKTDAPKTDAPKTAVPKTDAPKTDAPKTDAPKTNPPETDAPPGKSAAPKTEAPKTDAPKTNPPKTDAPKTSIPDTLTPGHTHPPATPAPPTAEPTAEPTALPTAPTATPTAVPTAVPTAEPTALPEGHTFAPKTIAPTVAPKTDVPKTDEPETSLPEGSTYAPKGSAPVTDADSGSDEGGSMLWVIGLVIGLIALVAVIAGGAFYMLKKPPSFNSKQNLPMESGGIDEAQLSPYNEMTENPEPVSPLAGEEALL